jgi:hypothetical protein
MVNVYTNVICTMCTSGRASTDKVCLPVLLATWDEL